jgi:hypothetical protein
MGKFSDNRRFSKFRVVRRVSAEAVGELVNEIKGKVTERGIISMSPIQSGIALDWEVVKRGGKIVFYTPELTKGRFRHQVREFLTEYGVIGFMLLCHTGQKIVKSDKEIKEMWDYRISWNELKPVLERIPHDQLYDYCTIDFTSGRKLPPEEEIIYCGPEGKIFGWDKI